MKINNILVICMITQFFISCQKNNNPSKVTNASDYNAYLEIKENNDYKNEISNLLFWENKLRERPSQYVYRSKIAASQTKLFQMTGEVSYLVKAENNLSKLNQKYTTASSLRALARNHISQHKFQQALKALLEAEKNGEKLHSTQKMLFDVHLELGNYDKAEEYLTKIRIPNDFDYFIRAAKWNDVKGNLNVAISYLERALNIAEASKNNNLILWSYTNIADFYGHNNEIEKSYQYYLKSLKIDPNNAYAKKGIAWIVYSHENNPKEALRIINKIQQTHKSPDYFLLKAELAEYSGNKTELKKNIDLYLSAVKNKFYGDMYNQYNIKLYLDELGKVNEALAIIQEEIKNRPTPQTYDLLAWARFKQGNYKEALQIANQYVKSKSFEPETLYRLAKIYSANNLNEEAKNLKSELMESQYEVGPLMFQKIKQL